MRRAAATHPPRRRRRRRRRPRGALFVEHFVETITGNERSQIAFGKSARPFASRQPVMSVALPKESWSSGMRHG